MVDNRNEKLVFKYLLLAKFILKTYKEAYSKNSNTLKRLCADIVNHVDSLDVSKFSSKIKSSYAYKTSTKTAVLNGGVLSVNKEEILKMAALKLIHLYSGEINQWKMERNVSNVKGNNILIKAEEDLSKLTFAEEIGRSHLNQKGVIHCSSNSAKIFLQSELVKYQTKMKVLSTVT